MTGADRHAPLGGATVTAAIHRAYSRTLALVSPPRTGSSLIGRMLWQHPAITHHCHEPFESCYWGGHGPSTAARNLLHPMDLTTGEQIEMPQVPPGSGLLVKEMSFQLTAEQFISVADLATAPVVFVIRDPRLSTTSRLRIVRELFDNSTFPPFESGWPSLAQQVRLCREHRIDYLIVESTIVRRQPDLLAQRLLERVGLPVRAGVTSWPARPGLTLCPPETGALMSDKRRRDDPFYRRILSSRGVQPPDSVNWNREEELIAAAGLSDHVAQWQEIYHDLLTDSHLLHLTPADPARDAHTPYALCEGSEHA